MLSITLDLVLGLSYVFMVLSLIVTSLTELLASWCKWRAVDLKKGIESLLQNPGLAKQFFEHPLIQNMSSAPTSNGAAAKGAEGPSYIATVDFAAVVYNDICGAGAIAIKTPEQLKALLQTIPDPNLQKTLQTLAAQVNHDVDDFKQEIETWFDRGMDRVAGWYKRRVQWVTLWVGFTVVILLNANAIAISQKILTDPAMRDALVKQADVVGGSTTGAPTAPDQKEALSQLHDLDNLIGWQSSSLLKIDTKHLRTVKIALKDILSSIPGWCLTAIAVSLGAPFWFDILKQIIAIRGAGKVPAPSLATTQNSPA